MSDYYLSSSNQTFSLYEDKIMYNQGSGSTDERQECTFDWYVNQDKLTMVDFLNISEQVSGSNQYVKHKGWL
tara:strand:+ start:121 stop:336 length:216 start_codon:yes stop_codon:yes gene_type:complete